MDFTRVFVKITKEDLLFLDGELNQASKTAQVLKETMDSLDDIKQLFYEGVSEARGNPNGWIRKNKRCGTRIAKGHARRGFYQCRRFRILYLLI